VPFPYSIYRDVQQVRPGSYMVLRAGQPPREEVYWDLEAVVRSGREHQLDELSDAELVDKARDLLAEAVRCRMLADVPLGAFLSGGVDSSAVVALMQSLSSQKVRTFSIGSTDPSYDESLHARRIANHLGTEHTELIVTPEEALGLVPELAGSTDEPFADSSFIPTWLVSRLARQDVTVALSGDGGDEMFAGYQRHLIAGSRLASVLRLPRGLRRSIAGGLLAVEPRRWDAVARRTPGLRRVPRAGEQVHKAARVASVADLDALYDDLTSHWTPHDDVVLGGVSEPPSWSLPATTLPDPVDRFLYRDATGYLRDDILQKVDRASMAVSLEARVPLLDHRVAEFAWQLPPHARVRNGRTKWVLREVLALYVPTALTDRPKSGFGVPLGSWLRGPLREWAEELIAPDRLRDGGYFDPGPIHARWREHLSGTADWQHHLWDILSFQAWLDQTKRDAAPPR
jgi:asparagine synthase (glutamine-hydrolysing)